MSQRAALPPSLLMSNEAGVDVLLCSYTSTPIFSARRREQALMSERKWSRVFGKPFPDLSLVHSVLSFVLV